MRRPSAARTKTPPSHELPAMMEVDRDLPPLPVGREHHSMSTDQEGSTLEVAAPTTDKLPTPELSEDEKTVKPDCWEQLDASDG